MPSRRRLGVLAVLLAALLVNLPLVHSWWSERRLDNEGIRTVATVLEAQSLPQTGEERRYFLAYRLPDHVDPEQRDFVDEVDRPTYDDARRSEQVEVVYRPGTPAENRPVGHAEGGWLTLFLALLADLALVAVLALMLWGGRTQRGTEA